MRHSLRASEPTRPSMWCAHGRVDSPGESQVLKYVKVATSACFWCARRCSAALLSLSSVRAAVAGALAGTAALHKQNPMIRRPDIEGGQERSRVAGVAYCVSKGEVHLICSVRPHCWPCGGLTGPAAPLAPLQHSALCAPGSTNSNSKLELAIIDSPSSFDVYAFCCHRVS